MGICCLPFSACCCWARGWKPQSGLLGGIIDCAVDRPLKNKKGKRECGNFANLGDLVGRLTGRLFRPYTKSTLISESKSGHVKLSATRNFRSEEINCQILKGIFTLVDSLLIHLQFTLESRLIRGRVKEVGGRARVEVHGRAAVRARREQLVLGLRFHRRIWVKLALETRVPSGAFKLTGPTSISLFCLRTPCELVCICSARGRKSGGASSTELTIGRPPVDWMMGEFVPTKLFV